MFNQRGRKRTATESFAEASQPRMQAPAHHEQVASAVGGFIERNDREGLEQNLVYVSAEALSALVQPSDGSKWMKRPHMPITSVLQYRCTCLHLAAVLGHSPLCRLLLDKGADPNVKDSEGNGTLAMAAAGGKAQTVKLILEAGGRVTDENELSALPLHVACRHGSKQVVQLLLEQPGVDVESASFFYDEIPLFVAAFCGHLEVARLLVEKGANVNAKVTGDLMPIHMAARRSKTDMINFLAQKGADVNALAWVTKDDIDFKFPFKERGVHKGSSLNFAVESSRDGKSVKALLDNNADPEAVTKVHPKTPLTLAAKKLKMAIVKILLDGGARLDYPELQATSPLLSAITAFVPSANWEQKEDAILEAVKFFMEAGSSVQAVNARYRQNGMHLSLLSELPRVFSYLMDRGGDPFVKDKCGDCAIKDLLQGHGGNCRRWVLCCLRGGAFTHDNLMNYHNMSPVEYAVQSDDINLVKMYNAAGFLTKRYIRYMDNFNGEIRSYVKNAKRQVLSLKTTCRKVVSNAIGIRVGRQAGITALLVKNEVKQYLMFCDLESLLEPAVQRDPWDIPYIDVRIHMRPNKDTDLNRCPYESDEQHPDWSAIDEEGGSHDDEEERVGW